MQRLRTPIRRVWTTRAQLLCVLLTCCEQLHAFPSLPWLPTPCKHHNARAWTLGMILDLRISQLCTAGLLQLSLCHMSPQTGWRLYQDQTPLLTGAGFKRSRHLKLIQFVLFSSLDALIQQAAAPGASEIMLTLAAGAADCMQVLSGIMLQNLLHTAQVCTHPRLHVLCMYNTCPLLAL